MILLFSFILFTKGLGLDLFSTLKAQIARKVAQKGNCLSKDSMLAPEIQELMCAAVRRDLNKFWSNFKGI